jgi:hypothetical protein
LFAGVVVSRIMVTCPAKYYRIHLDLAGIWQQKAVSPKDLDNPRGSQSDKICRTISYILAKERN